MRLDSEELLGELGWLRRLARGLVGGAGVDEDLVQETWLAARGVEGGVSRAWLAGTLRKLAARWRRTESRMRRRESEAARPEGVETESMVERSELFALVLDELRALDEPFRSALLALYQEGLTISEAALILGIPVDTLRWQRREGLARLRSRLDRGTGLDWRGALAPLFSLPSKQLTAGTGAAGGLAKIAAFMGGTLMTWKLTSAAVVAGLAILYAVFGRSTSVEIPASLEVPVPLESAATLGAPELPEREPAVNTREGALALSSPPDGETLSVEIIGEDDQRLAGALVWLGESPEPVDGVWQSNAEGIAVVPMPAGDMAQISSSTATHYGNTLIFPARTGGEAWVKLFPDADVTVELVDEAGRPVAGVPVVRGNLFRKNRWTLTDARGVAVLHHVLDPFKFNTNFHEFTVGPAILSRVPLRVTLSREDVPTERVRIVLPPLGSVDVRVLDAAGLPNAAAELVHLVVDPNPGALRDAVELTAESKRATLGAMELELQDGMAKGVLVGLGLELFAEAKDAEATHSTFGFATGPRSDGARVELVLRPLDVAAELVGVLRGDDGLLFADRTVNALVLLGEGLATEWERLEIRTDEVGRFRIPIEKQLIQKWAQLTSRSLVLRVEDADSFELGHLETTLPESVRPGANDLGTVILTRLTPWLSGRAIDEDGNDVELGSMTVYVQTPEGPKSSRRFIGLEVAVAGSEFAALGEAPKLDVDAGEAGVLVLSAEGHPRGSMELLGRRQGLVFTFREAGSLEGHVETVAGDDPSNYYAVFHPEGEGESSRYGMVALATNGRFEVEELPAIPGTLEIHTFGLDTIVAFVAGVVPGSDSKEQAARLNSIVLHAPLNVFDLKIVDQDGNDVEGAYFAAPSLLGKVQPGDYGYGASWLSWRLTEEQLEGEVGAPGFAPRQVTLLPGGETVTLVPGPEVILRPSEATDLANGAELVVRLVAVDWPEEVVLEPLAGIGFVGHVSRPGEYFVRGEVHLDGVAIVERPLSGDPTASIIVTEDEREFDVLFDPEVFLLAD